MRVAQVLPTFVGKDAIGNEVAILARAIHKAGYGSCIVSEWASKDAMASVPAEHCKSVTDAHADALIYHHSIGSDLGRQFAASDARKILRYHNVTPPGFFEEFDSTAARRCARGLDQVASIAPDVDLCLAASRFNKDDLIEMGFTCPIEVLPVLIPFEDYEKEPDERLLSKFDAQQGTKILFVGRVAPNKCQHDVLKAFFVYKKRYDPNARLYIVGGYSVVDGYYGSLVKYVEDLGLTDVVFAGSVPFSQLIAYYQAADLFLCQSEHEGFCVPLVEAMFFDVPVVAYDATAVLETLGPNTLVLQTKDPEVVAGVMHLLMTDEVLKKRVLQAQRERLADFEENRLGDRVLEILQDLEG